MAVVRTALQMLVGMAFLGLTFLPMVAMLLVLLPWRARRARLSNYYGKLIGRFALWVFRCPLTVTGAEQLDRDRPVIYIANHCSQLDVFVAILLSPIGTVGVAKRSALLVPFFGQIYALSGNLAIDRGNGPQAIARLKRTVSFAREHGISLYIWPEGTRSPDGHMLPFKKGVVHMALQTGLPIVPMVVQGTHKAWAKGRFVIDGGPVRVDVLPPIDTAHWSADHLDQALDELHAVYAAALPEDQKPMAIGTT